MEQFKITGGSQQGESKRRQMICNNCLLGLLFDSHTFFFSDPAAIILFSFLPSLKQNVEMFAQNACPWWDSRLNSSPHAANHCVFTMYPVWTPRWTQITSIQPLCKMAQTETTWMYQVPAQTTLKLSWSSGPVPPQPHLCPAVGLSSSAIQHPKTPICRLQSDPSCSERGGGVSEDLH